MDIGLEKIYRETLEEFPEMTQYFPDYDQSYVPPRQFFWDVMNAVVPRYVKQLLDNCRLQRCGVGENADEMEMIEIKQDLLDEIRETPYYRSKSLNCRVEQRKDSPLAQGKIQLGFQRGQIESSSQRGLRSIQYGQSGQEGQDGNASRQPCKANFQRNADFS